MIVRDKHGSGDTHAHTHTHTHTHTSPPIGRSHLSGIEIGVNFPMISAAARQSEICMKFSVFHTIFDVKFW